MQNSGFEEIHYQEQIDRLSPEKVAKLKEKIELLAQNSTKNAQTSIYQAISALNNIPGFQEHVGSIQTEKYNSVFEGVVGTLNHLANEIDSKSTQTRTELQRKLQEQTRALEEARRKKEEQERLLEEERRRKEEEERLRLEQERIQEEERKRKEEEERLRKEKEQKEAEERKRKEKEFSLDNLLHGNYFSVLDQMESNEKQKVEERKQKEAEDNQNPYLQSILSSAAIQGFGSEKYGDKIEEKE